VTVASDEDRERLQGLVGGEDRVDELLNPGDGLAQPERPEQLMSNRLGCRRLAEASAPLAICVLMRPSHAWVFEPSSLSGSPSLISVA
jgi:hypothetical protein